ncbi:hypothetical protein MTR_7g072625 [Medicago truncatula]|uniref:Uncharacterized protein n=1 Tax=Medicago truncatula TaxID=3880 RepID=A0A072UBM9_MEDTR|nr:hypothetical protein MTR_7g072625 [Medicago truncatula]
MEFNFSSPLGMGRVASKYMRVGDEDGEGKTRPRPIAMPIRHGDGAGWGRVLPSSSPSPTLIYLLVILPISNGDDK